MRATVAFNGLILEARFETIPKDSCIVWYYDCLCNEMVVNWMFPKNCIIPTLFNFNTQYGLVHKQSNNFPKDNSSTSKVIDSVFRILSKIYDETFREIS